MQQVNVTFFFSSKNIVDKMQKINILECGDYRMQEDLVQAAKRKMGESSRRGERFLAVIRHFHIVV